MWQYVIPYYFAQCGAVNAGFFAFPSLLPFGTVIDFYQYFIGGFFYKDGYSPFKIFSLLPRPFIAVAPAMYFNRVAGAFALDIIFYKGFIPPPPVKIVFLSSFFISFSPLVSVWTLALSLSVERANGRPVARSL
jgi:hypothetical protein